MAKSGKGAVQGAVQAAVQACCEAAAQSAVAKSGRGAVLSRVLCRLWLAAVRSGGKVWETCCAACCRLARSGKGYAAGCWLREGAVHRIFQRCCRVFEVWHGAVLCRLLARAWCRLLPRVRWRGLAKVLCRLLCRVRWEALSAGCCAGCCPQCEATASQRIMLGTKFDCAL